MEIIDSAGNQGGEGFAENMALNFYPIFIPLFGCQVSAPPPAKKIAGQIEKETDVRRSICLLFNPGSVAKAASLIIKKPCHFGVVSYEVSGLRGSAVKTKNYTDYIIRSA